MKFSVPRSLRCVGIGALALAGAAAHAHTGHGVQGFSQGLIHPLGLDHLLAMVAVGLWSVGALPQGKAWWGPALFMLTLVSSAALGALGLSLPFLDHLISLSVIVFGAMLVLARHKMPLPWGLAMLVLAASLHGLAHGAEAPSANFYGYAGGFLVSTAALHAGGVAASKGVRRYMASVANWTISGLGALLGGAGLYLFVTL